MSLGWSVRNVDAVAPDAICWARLIDAASMLAFTSPA